MPKMRIKIIVLSILAVTLLTSCSEYQKVLKSSDYNLKYEKALVYYEKGDYYRAQSLFDELVTIFKGSDKSEKILFYYANCHYKQKDYILGAYYFENFAKTFPYSEFTEEASYTSAYCYYLNSPRYSLDQADTYKAIDAMQLFINKYPGSKYITEANDIIEKLRTKLEKKSYENAKLYYKIGDYQSAAVALHISIKEFPDTKYREEVLYLIVKTNFLLAENSIREKQGERYQNTITEYYSFIDEFPTSEYTKEIEKMYTISVNQIKTL